MTFFDPPPPPPPPVPDFPSMPRQGRYVPGVVPLEEVLARNESAAIVLRALFVYPDGVSFQLDTYTRRPEDVDFDDFSSSVVSGSVAFAQSALALDANSDESEPETDFDVLDRPSRTGAGAMQRFLRGGLSTFEDVNFGVQFPDGVKVTTLRPYVPDFDMMRPPTEPPKYGLDMGGGGGSDTHYEYSFFVWPLPEAGTLKLVCEWSRHGIPETAHEIDTGPIIEAARRSRVLWEEDEGLPSHHSMAVSMVAMHRYSQTFRPDDRP
jgi:hypothetical protein